MSVKKKKLSVNILVRAEFLTSINALPPARPPASGDHYTPQPIPDRGNYGAAVSQRARGADAMLA